MIEIIKTLISDLKTLFHLLQLEKAQSRLVVYSEGPRSWPHVGPVLEHLIAEFDVHVTYVTARSDDPGLKISHEQFTGYHLSSITLTGILFQRLKATVFVSSLPDLDSFHLKRSMHPVHYVYVHHSMVSTHMIYNEKAFDNFDTIFAVGPHHVEETRRAEALRGLPTRNIVEHGYAKLDNIRAQAKASMSEEKPPGKHVLIAPTWGEKALLERQLGSPVIANLLANGFQVTLRPHPETAKRNVKVIEEIRKRFSANDLFSYDTDTAGWDSLVQSDIMISDWSGAALEYAFGLGKPVIFIDVPKKINNENYLELGVEPIECVIREKIGTIIREDRIDTVAAHAEKLLADPKDTSKAIRKARKETVFNVGKSAKVGADALYELLLSIEHKTEKTS